ncbi:hypothetical protein MKW94_004133 [Papaver nudicaule]|uniref:Galactose oxidase n=1 Tax=Papaver nudicaule TaxID=74823 RepID=A0AA42ASP8_PAPNU|nr:hypothetical protein [Papaver nudicaule]
MGTTKLIIFFVVLLVLIPALGSRRSFEGGVKWQLLHKSIGISAMHMQLLHNNKIVMYDRTDFGPSNLSLSNGRCRVDSSDTALKRDCTAHSLLYDIKTNSFRPLMVHTDTFCSSGAVLPNGMLVQTGGFNDGDRVIRTFAPCNSERCDWTEHVNYLSVRRWYATNQILPDGRIIIVGGRRQFSYEFYPKRGSASSNLYNLSFLRETRDKSEDNLYPFIHLLPDGNLFIFANTRSILLDYVNNHVIREFPHIPNANSRNYPSSGSSILLPLDLSSLKDPTKVEAEIIICGGAPPRSYLHAERGRFVHASSTCGRLKVSDPKPVWVMEKMPLPRVMGDMLILPTGDLMIINGARSGTAGWLLGRDPVLEPVGYSPHANVSSRFSLMNPSTRPRMYHSASVLVPDGRIIVGGSNPNEGYNFTGVLFPTDLSLEAFHPPYLAPHSAGIRPRITNIGNVFTYGGSRNILFTVSAFRGNKEISVRILSPSFSTHSFGMSQRMVVLRLITVSQHHSQSAYQATVTGPPTAQIAPPGYYMLFVVHAGVPSPGVWVRINA